MVNRSSLRYQSQKTGYTFRARSCKVQAEKRCSTRRAPTTAKSMARTGTAASVPPRLRVAFKREDTPETIVSDYDTASASTSSCETTPIRSAAIPRRRASSSPTGASSHRQCVFPGCYKQNRARHLATHPEWLSEQWQKGGESAFFATLSAHASLVCDDPSHQRCIRPRSNLSHFWMHIKEFGCIPVHPILAYADTIRLASSNPQRAQISESSVLAYVARRGINLDGFAPHWRVPGKEYLVGGPHYGSTDELLAKLRAPDSITAPEARGTRTASLEARSARTTALPPFSSWFAGVPLGSGSDDEDREWAQKTRSDPGPIAHYAGHGYEEQDEEPQHTRCDLRPGTPYASSGTDEDTSDGSSLDGYPTPYDTVQATQQPSVLGLQQYWPAFEHALLNHHIRFNVSTMDGASR